MEGRAFVPHATRNGRLQHRRGGPCLDGWHDGHDRCRGSASRPQFEELLVHAIDDRTESLEVTERRARGPWGLAGGEDGAPGRNRLRDADGSERALPAKGSFRVEAGATLTLETPGGGGWGEPDA